MQTLQNIISFDVGTRNPVFCEVSLYPTFSIQKWELINICKEIKSTIPCDFMQKNKKKCKSLACCHTPTDPPTYYCKKHKKNQQQWFVEHPKEHSKSNLTKKNIEELQTIYTKLYLQTNKNETIETLKKGKCIDAIITLYQQNTLIPIINKKENADLIPILEIAKRLTEQLKQIKFAENATVLIENQITDKMKMVQALLMEYFLLQYPNANVICYSPTHKLKLFEKKFEEIKNGHTKNKINSIYHCAKLIEANKDLIGEKWINKITFDEILNGKKQSKKNEDGEKMDDLADTFLQLISYLEQCGMIELIGDGDEMLQNYTIRIIS